MRTFLNLDAVTSAFIQRELQAIEAKVYETPVGPFRAEEFIPVDSIPRGAQQWGYDRVTSRGMARWLASHATDIINVSVEKTRVVYDVKEMAIGYSYSLSDLLSAQMTGMPLDATLARAARRGIDAFKNRVLLEGDAEVGFTGLINDSSVPQANASFADWDGSGATTPDQIIASMMAPIWTIMARVAENSYLMPDTLLLPFDQYRHISTTPRSATSETTILEFFMKNQGFIKTVAPLFELATAGTGSTPRAIYYKRDPEIVVAQVAIPFEARPVQERGFDFFTPCWARIGGTHWRTPVAAQYIDNV